MTTDPQPNRKIDQKLFPFMISGESVDEFNELFFQLIDEWEPSGRTAFEAIFVLAALMWRRMHLNFYLDVEKAPALFGAIFKNKDQPGLNENRALLEHTEGWDPAPLKEVIEKVSVDNSKKWKPRW